MNINEIRELNAIALQNLAALLGMTDEETDAHIKRIRDEFMEHKDLKVSEVIPIVVKTKNIDDIMAGAILAIFMSDFHFDEYIKGEL